MVKSRAKKLEKSLRKEIEEDLEAGEPRGGGEISASRFSVTMVNERITGD